MPAVMPALLLAGAALTLPVPSGPYAVGVTRSEIADRSRPLDTTDPRTGSRRLPVIVWYPARAGTTGSSPYIPRGRAAATQRALARNLAYAPDELAVLTTATTPAVADAPPAHGRRPFPIVLMSHGLLSYPEQNSILAQRLAANGYVVVAIAHPGDVTDVSLADGTEVPSRIVREDVSSLAGTIADLARASPLADKRRALDRFATALDGTRVGRSLATWRADMIHVARTIATGSAPAALAPILATADRRRMAFVGMSFGGMVSASACRLVATCRAAVNLDGLNLDRAMFDAPAGRPLLVLASDWTRYPVVDGQTRSPAYSPNDLAYEPWQTAGRDRRVLRVRLEGVRHIGFTDLVALLDGPRRDERVGAIASDRAVAATNGLVQAFLDVHLRRAAPRAIDAALRRPGLVRHHPVWLRDQYR